MILNGVSKSLQIGHNDHYGMTKCSHEQAGAELGQAQLKLGLDFNSINLN